MRFVKCNANKPSSIIPHSETRGEGNCCIAPIESSFDILLLFMKQELRLCLLFHYNSYLKVPYLPHWATMTVLEILIRRQF